MVIVADVPKKHGEFSGQPLKTLEEQRPHRDKVIGEVLDELKIFDEWVFLERPPDTMMLQELKTQIQNLWRHNASIIFTKRQEMGIEKQNTFTNDGCGVAFEFSDFLGEHQALLRIVVYADNLSDINNRKYFKAILNPVSYRQPGQFFINKLGQGRIRKAEGGGKTRTPISDQYHIQFRKNMRLDIRSLVTSSSFSKYVSLFDVSDSERRIKDAREKRLKKAEEKESRKHYGIRTDPAKTRTAPVTFYRTDFKKHKLPKVNEKPFLTKDKQSVVKVAMYLKSQGYNAEQIKKYVEVNKEYINKSGDIKSALKKAGYTVI